MFDMPKNDFPDYGAFERRILELKSGISKASHERWQASIAGDQRRLLEARKKTAQCILENCEAIAKYVSSFSPPLARELAAQQQVAKEKYKQISQSGDLNAVHAWYKQSLIPALKTSEQAAHIAATGLRRGRREALAFHRWTRSG